VAAMGLAACGDKNTADNATSTVPGAEATDHGQLPAATEDNTAGDQQSIDFIQKVAMSDLFEVEASKLALTKSQSASIKSFAQSMITAHTATTATLKPLAAALKIDPPVALDSDHATKIDDLKKATVKEFDQKYVDQQTEAHNKALDLLNDEAKNGNDATLKGFAAATAPKVQMHLDTVKKLDKSGVDEPKNSADRLVELKRAERPARFYFVKGRRHGASAFARACQQIREERRQHGVAGQEVALQRIAAVQATHKAASFTHQNDAGRDVPRLQTAFPECVKAASGDPRHVQSGGAKTAHARNLVADHGQFAEEGFVAGFAVIGDAGSDHRFVELCAGGDAQPPIVQERAAAALGGEDLIAG
jgi:putative membrane protein